MNKTDRSELPAPAVGLPVERPVRPRSLDARLMADRLLTLGEGRKHSPERATLEAAAALMMLCAEAMDCAATDAECQRLSVERLTRERDEWAAKWQDMRRQYAQLRWPGLTGVVKALEA